MLNKAIRNILQIPGWKTRKKIIVFESDDWGSIRMPSNKVRDNLSKMNPDISNDLYCKYDNLENSDDLTALFQVLKKHKDKNGQHPVITANTIVANPNFEKIKHNHFNQYYFETFNETLEHYYPGQNIFNLYKQGINEGIFYPQFHGREHLNVSMWLNELKNKNKLLVEAFTMGVFGIPIQSDSYRRNNFMAAFDLLDSNEFKNLESNIEEGLELFKSFFNYNSKTIISPCYVWPDELGEVLSRNGVNAYQGMRFQFKPNINRNKYKRSYHFTGQREKHNLTYLVRNAFFEPTHFQNQSHLDELISKINTAFKWRNPVINGTHRINFIGSLDETNRKINLQKLDQLLYKILLLHPDVEFYHSAQLIDEINNSRR